MLSLTQATNHFWPRSGDYRALASKLWFRVYPPCAGKLVSRVPAMGTFGDLNGHAMGLSVRARCPSYSSHGPELERWALPFAELRADIAGGYLSRLGRALEVASPRGLGAYWPRASMDQVQCLVVRFDRQRIILLYGKQ